VAKLSNHEVLNLAYKVGWRKSGDLERVLAIVLAESSGDTEVTSYTGCCHGLMQINTRVHRQWTTADMKQAEPNMRAGFQLWTQAGHTWRDWNASRGGQLLRGPEARASLATWHLSPDIGGPPGTGVGDVGKAIQTTVPGLSDVLAIANRARAWVTTPANIGRLAIAVLGGLVIVIGVGQLLRPVAEKTLEVAKAVK
jgi:hypothetical protein